uniref:ANTH domain-containing protein n=1 Tax=Heterorhabditis bacteriophora TaxID=37862 RepID=A0A1I7XAG7_HETBA
MLKYEDLAKSRRVSKFMNGLVKYLLNRGYMVLGNLIEKTKSEIKKELPRRESLRRSHRLSGLSDAYSAVDTRYALLSMTYRKYIDSGVACFIPGKSTFNDISTKVLDECFRVLGLLKQYYDCGGYFKENINELLRDFRDLSSMAMEHFEEHIQPLLKTPQKNLIGETFILPDEEMVSPCIPFPTTSSTSRSADSDWARTINEKIADHENIIKKQNNTINTLKLAVSQLGSICTQLANKSGVDHNINGILENLYDAMESKSEFVDVGFITNEIMGTTVLCARDRTTYIITIPRDEGYKIKAS